MRGAGRTASATWARRAGRAGSEEVEWWGGAEWAFWASLRILRKGTTQGRGERMHTAYSVPAGPGYLLTWPYNRDPSPWVNANTNVCVRGVLDAVVIAASYESAKQNGIAAVVRAREEGVAGTVVWGVAEG